MAAAISRPQFQRFQRNLARWRNSAFVTVWSVTNLRYEEIQDGGGRHPNNLKITISRQRFDRSVQHLAWWRILALWTRRAIHANSYVTCITLFRKLSYVRKIVNSCVNIRMIAAVVRQKISVKIASWWSYLNVSFYNHDINLFTTMLVKCK